mgnify:CR=1 FL=1
MKCTRYFAIEDGKLVGEGADYLVKEMKSSQYLLLGEYHHSYQISKLTGALIPVLHNAGYRSMALEVGPESVKILKELSKVPEKVAGNLHAFNTKYHVILDSSIYVPIPFFENTEDAAFLKELAKYNWNLIGLDQEFIISYLPLLEKMQTNLGDKQKQQLTEAYLKAQRVIKEAYKTENDGGKEIQETLSESVDFYNYLELSSYRNKTNKKIADALRKTTSIYLKSVKKQYLEQNTERVSYMKENLANYISGNKYDCKHDKMFLKMGSVHSGRGFSPLSLYEIGNTISELAAYHGNKSLHISINSRFYVDKEIEIDELSDTTSYGYRLKPFLQMGKRDKWTLIDLRPLKYRVFYSREYKLEELILNIFKGYDIYLIPPVDIEPTLNLSRNAGE